MITFKNLSLEELKKDYSNRIGFVFESNQPSSDEAIENLCNTLITHEITMEFPEFVTRIGNATFFIYKENFDMPTFINNSTMAIQMRVCNVDTLYNVLNRK